ncbi:MAG TPA: helix-turn-helix domain-containing protein, partial [Chloroflexota bacterium]
MTALWQARYAGEPGRMMSTDAGPPTFGSLLLRYRLAAGFSQEELAERAGLSRRGISDLERGARRSPHPATVRRLIDALNLERAEAAALLAAAHAAMAPPNLIPDVPAGPTTSRSVELHSNQTTTESVAELVRQHPLNAGPTQPALAARHTLPVQLTSFVGRAREIADVRRELAQTRLLTLTGPGGVGKTRLALRVAEAELRSFADGVWFVELAPLTEAALVPQAVAALFNLREKPEESLATTVTAALQPLRILLILDNCEHVLTGCVDLVHRLLRACPHLAVLTTSREVLGSAAETVWRVPPLRISSAAAATGQEQSPENEAEELFVERARAVQPSFTISPDNAHAVLEVCQRVEGIPLAIELAASRVGAFGLDQLVERLATDTRFLLTKDRTAVRRQQTLENTIQWSYDLLTPEEQALFERLSVFAGGWTLEALEAIARDTDAGAGHELLELLERLIDKSLVQVDDTSGRVRRYRLLEPLRQFARTRLVAREEVAATQERHAAFFLEVFERAEQQFFIRFATPSLLTDMDRELGNLRVALRWLINQADVDRAQRLAGASRALWLQEGHLAEYRRWLDEALALDTGPPRAPAARARALLGLNGVAFLQGDLTVGEEAGLRSLQLFEDLHDTVRAAGALRFLGLIASERADLVRARRFMEDALVATRETAQAATVALTLCNLAEFALEEGDLVATHRQAEEALRLSTTEGHAGIACRALASLAEVEWRLDRRQAARRLCEEALARGRDWHRQRSTVVTALINLARLSARWGEAASSLSEGLRLARDGNQWDLARGLEVVVGMAAAVGKLELALHVAGAA